MRTIDGKVHEGTVSLEGAQFVITARAGAVKVDPAAVLTASFRYTVSRDNPLPAARWATADVGEVKTSERTVFDGANITIRASGLDIGYKDDTTRDDFRFLWQTMQGDGEVVARVVSCTQVNRPARVGIMIRDALDAGSANAMAFLMAESAGFQYRSTAKGETARANEVGIGKSGWLKLVRVGNTVTGYLSANGTIWQPLGNARIPLGASAYVGLAVASRRQEAACIAKFDSVSITPTVKPSSAVELPTMRTGLVLRGGSLVAGELRSLDDTSMRIHRNEKEQSLPAGAVAAMIFRPLTPAQLASVQTQRTGVLTPAGDFLDGEIKGYNGNRVRMSSVLFGAKNYDAGREVSAAVLQKVTPAPAAYEVLLNDGSVLLGNSLTLEKDTLILDEIGLGRSPIPLGDVVILRAGPARFHPLTAIRPAKVDRSPHALPGRPAMLSSTTSTLPALPTHPYDHAMLVAPGASITYALDGSAKTFLCHAAIPSPTLPTARVRLVILGDGKELYRTTDLGALDEPAAVTVAVAGIRSLTLRLEAVDLPELAPAMLLADPVLVK